MAATYRSDDRYADHRSPTDVDTRERRHALGTGLEVTVQAVVYVAIHAETLFGAAVLATTIGWQLPGIPGVVPRLTVGFGVVAVPPAATNWLCQLAVRRKGE